MTCLLTVHVYNRCHCVYHCVRLRPTGRRTHASRLFNPSVYSPGGVRPLVWRFVWLYGGIATMYTMSECVGGRIPFIMRMLYIAHNYYIITVTIYIYMVKYTHYYSTAGEMQTWQLQIASTCWSLIGLLVKWRRVHAHADTHNDVMCILNSYAKCAHSVMHSLSILSE